MGLLRREKNAINLRQLPGAAPTGTGIGGPPLTVDPNQGTVAPTLHLDTDVSPGGGFTTAPQLASGFTPVITLPPTATPTPTSSPESSSSASISASSSTAAPISVTTVVGSCVGAFIGAVALVFLGLWFYRRYHRSLKAQYRGRGRSPGSARAGVQRQFSRREPWDKLQDRNSDDKWQGQTKTEESVGPMEKLTMFKKAPSVRTAYTHTEEEPVQFEMSHPFSQQHSPYSNNQEKASLPNTWDDTKGSFLSGQTQPERLSGSMSPSLTMAIPTPLATASPHHHWESAEIVNMEPHSAEIVNPFADENKPTSPERRKSLANPFFGAHEDIPRRRSRSNSLASKTARLSRTHSTSDSLASSIHLPVPKVDKGKGRAIDPFDDQNTVDSFSPFDVTSISHPTVITSLPAVASTHAAPISPLTPLVPPRPVFAAHNPSSSTSSAASSERAIASLIAALDGAATEEEVQARLRITSVHSTTSNYSDTTETLDMHKDFPLPSFTPGQSTSTLESFITAESDRTVKTG